MKVYRTLQGLCLFAKSRVRLFPNPNPWPVACKAPLSVGLSRQEYCSELPGPPLGDLPSPGSNMCLLHRQTILYLCTTWEGLQRFSTTKFSVSVSELPPPDSMLTHTHTLSLSLSLSLTHTHTHTHTHTRTHSLSFSLSHLIPATLWPQHLLLPQSGKTLTAAPLPFLHPLCDVGQVTLPL